MDNQSLQAFDRNGAVRPGHGTSGGFHASVEIADTDDDALEEQLGRFQGQYAAASRAAARARFELEMLEGRDDINANILAQARRQQEAADARRRSLLRAIEALEEILERRAENC